MTEGSTDAQPPAPPPRKRRGWRRLLHCVEIAVFIALLPILALVIAVMLASDNRLRLPQGVETRITSALDAAVTTHNVSVREIEVELQDGRFTPEIVLQGVQLRDEGGGLRAFLPEVSVVVDGRALLQGAFHPRRIRLDEAGLRLARDAQGVLDLSVSMGSSDAALGITETLARIDTLFSSPAFAGLEEISGRDLVLLMTDEVTGQLIQSQDAVMVLEQKDEALTFAISGSVAASRDAQIELAVTRNPALGRNDILFAFDNIAARDLATASPALRWLDLLRAPMSGRLVGAIADDGRIGDVVGTLNVGAGAFSPRDGIDPIPVEELSATLNFDADGDRLDFEELRIATEALSFTASGQVNVEEGGDTLVGQLQFSDLSAAPDWLFDTPLDFQGGALDLRLSFQPEFDLTIGQAVLHDGPLRVRAFGSVRAQETGLETRIDARITELAARDLFPYWPDFIIPGTRDWVTENLTDGVIRDFAASIRSGDGPPQIGLRFDFDDMVLSPLDGMPPITGGAGYVAAMNEEFVLHVTRGQVEMPQGQIDLAGSTMIIEDTGPRNPDARFDLAVAGPVPAIGALLAGPPVNLLARSALDPANIATGFAEAEVGLDLTFRRVIPRDEILFSAQGTLSDIRTETLVEGRVLTADQLDLTVTPEVVAIAGRAQLDGVGMTARWSQVLGADEGSRAEGRLQVNRDSLAALGITLPPGLLSGSGGADFALRLPPGAPPELRLSSDLAGIGLAIPGLPWRLSQTATGTFDAELTLGGADQSVGLSVTGAGLDLVATVDLGAEGQFQALQIERGEIAGLADISGRLTPGRLRITGGTVDLRRLGGAGGGGGGLAIDASLGRLVLTDGIALTAVSADLSSGLSGSFSGRVNGGAALSGAIERTAQGLSIDIQASDAGQVLRSAGLFQTAYGGEMALALRPTGAAGAYDGQLSVDGARIRDAPAMAELLNAISVVGLLEQLSAEGINLGDLDAEFRIRPGVIVLDRGSAVGPSMGISMDGLYRTDSQSIDMQGVVSPFYLVNGIAGAFFAPRREGLFGFTYRLTGSPGATNVSVNPLSILTPGIFREIFRRPPPELATE